MRCLTRAPTSKTAAPSAAPHPISDATAFGQRATASRLLERGATTTLGEAATLGVIDRVRGYLDAEIPPTPEEITEAFWSACHGNQPQAADVLLRRGPTSTGSGGTI